MGIGRWTVIILFGRVRGISGLGIIGRDRNTVSFCIHALLVGVVVANLGFVACGTSGTCTGNAAKQQSDTGTDSGAMSTVDHGA